MKPVWKIVPDHTNLHFPFSVSLGSIPELPADSCAAIKASEGGQAVSGIYWLDATRTGNSILARCDMKTEGKHSFCMVQWSWNIVSYTGCEVVGEGGGSPLYQEDYDKRSRRKNCTSWGKCVEKLVFCVLASSYQAPVVCRTFVTHNPCV